MTTPPDWSAADKAALSIRARHERAFFLEPPMTAPQPPTKERLAEFLAYDCETGIFTWKMRPPRSRIKSTVGTVHRNGYICIRVLGKRYYAHRLAWFLHHGVWPDNEVDHMNGVRSDNRICNLRLLPDGLNVQNMRRPSKRSTTGLLGVSMCKKNGTFRAHISVGGKTMALGYYKTPELAHEAYVKAKRELHAPCTL